MKLQGAVVKEQGITFAIVVVKRSAIQTATATATDADAARKTFRVYFPGLPLVLASQDSRGRFEYQGRRDIVNFLANIDPARIPWMEYTIP
jgi:hypothetical protein